MSRTFITKRYIRTEGDLCSEACDFLLDCCCKNDFSDLEFCQIKQQMIRSDRCKKSYRDKGEKK